MVNQRPTGGPNIECKDCKQLIRVLYGYNGARNVVINVKDGEGGKAQEEHVCPFRLQSGSYADKKRMKKQYLCHRCTKYYSGVFIECPNCFQLQCQRCAKLYPWQLEYSASAPKPTREGANCPRCGGLYNDLVTITRATRFIKRKRFWTWSPFKSGDDSDYKIFIELEVYEMVKVPPFNSHEEGVILRGFKHGNAIVKALREKPDILR